MERLLRQIKTPRWSTTTCSWLAPGEFQANAFKDLEPASNALSVYRCGGDQETVGRIAAALTVKKGNLDDFGYALIDPDELDRHGITMDSSEKGNTDFAFVNDLHVNLVQLSGTQLCAIAQIVYRSTRDELDEDDVLRFIKMSIDRNDLLVEKMPQHIRKHLPDIASQ